MDTKPKGIVAKLSRVLGIALVVSAVLMMGGTLHEARDDAHRMDALRQVCTEKVMAWHESRGEGAEAILFRRHRFADVSEILLTDADEVRAVREKGAEFELWYAPRDSVEDITQFWFEGRHKGTGSLMIGTCLAGICAACGIACLVLPKLDKARKPETTSSTALSIPQSPEYVPSALDGTLW